jgi:succinate-semialdehyde dehydrogenase/glutarate-semialdehyde dehydrogenase
MELGGNAPFVVLADADVRSAVDGALVAKLRNSGATCTAANRCYVHRSVAAQFTEHLAAAMRDLRVGPGLDPDSELGALVSVAERDKVAGIVDRAVALGASPVVAGSLPELDGAFYAPTVLSDVPPDAPILDQEIFGPVAPIVVFDDEEEAIDLANDTEYGLIATCTPPICGGLPP